MISIIKSIFWLAVFLIVAYFVLGYFGYEINKNYFSDSRKKCEDQLKECTSNVIHQGVDNAKCDFQCVDPKLIIKKK